MKIFTDLDGTLIDTSRRHYKVYTEVVAEFGGKPIEFENYWQQKRRKTSWAELLKLSELNPSIQADFLDSFRDKIEEPEYLVMDEIIPGAFKTLSALHSTNDLILVSLRRKPENLKAQLHAIGLSNFFNTVLSGHSESDGSDMKIKLIHEHLDGRPAVIIGDTEADILAGKELGLKTIAVESGIRDKQFLEALKPDQLITSIADLAELQ